MQRRAFTLGAAALAVAGTMSLSMNVAMAKDIAMTADVVVIGAGTAGTAAALAAAETGAKVITLGRRILRTETAGLATLAVLMFELEQ